MEPAILWLIEALPSAAVLTLAAAVQGAVGFGLGLVAIPALLWMGHPLPQAVALFAGAATVQTTTGIWHGHRQLDLPLTARVGLAQVVGVPLGVWAMTTLLGAGPDHVKQIVGLCVLLALIAQFYAPDRHGSLDWWWGPAAGFTAGVLAGAVGMAGPPLVLYAMAHPWSKDQFRVFLWSQILLGLPILLCLLLARFGNQVGLLFLTGLAYAPFLWLGTRLGIGLTARVDAQAIKRAAWLMLLIVALLSIGMPVLS